jgi:hypothetical protein
LTQSDKKKKKERVSNWILEKEEETVHLLSSSEGVQKNQVVYSRAKTCCSPMG